MMEPMLHTRFYVFLNNHFKEVEVGCTKIKYTNKWKYKKPQSTCKNSIQSLCNCGIACFKKLSAGVSEQSGSP